MAPVAPPIKYFGEGSLDFYNGKDFWAEGEVPISYTVINLTEKKSGETPLFLQRISDFNKPFLN
ncbi:hypothetical protein [Bacillus sp. FJAT-42376]|uniref:hypothetical protein n=1 Tax=Bacillus sp. FJAT-42376 TaxID=2014076 RepID=UPI000F4D8191|nr:hypothetical protein [Bacillus sp. FJAT-42376]